MFTMRSPRYRFTTVVSVVYDQRTATLLHSSEGHFVLELYTDKSGISVPLHEFKFDRYPGLATELSRSLPEFYRSEALAAISRAQVACLANRRPVLVLVP